MKTVGYLLLGSGTFVALALLAQTPRVARYSGADFFDKVGWFFPALMLLLVVTGGTLSIWGGTTARQFPAVGVMVNLALLCAVGSYLAFISREFRREIGYCPEFLGALLLLASVPMLRIPSRRS